MNPPQCPIQILPHLGERQRQRRTPPDQDVIMARLHLAVGGEPDDFPQSAPDAVTLHGIANLFRHREADTRGAGVSPRARLYHERGDGRARAACGGTKVRSARQSLHGDGMPITHSVACDPASVEPQSPCGRP
jgi:hypothetical protein